MKVCIGADINSIGWLSLHSKDVRIPKEMQRAMAAEAEASREARAKVGTTCLCIISMLLAYYLYTGVSWLWSECLDFEIYQLLSLPL